MKRLLLAISFATVILGQTAAQPVPSYKTLKYPPLPQVKIPEPAEFTLSNGMRVLLLEDHELPLIRGLALVRTGNLLDPPDKRGLSQVMADVLRSGGTKSKTGDCGRWKLVINPLTTRKSKPGWMKPAAASPFQD